MSPERLVSVVVPCYDQARFLGDALDSLEAQTGVATEVVVVDDGSPEPIAPGFADRSGIRWVRQANSGLAGARNRGLRECRADFVAFLDADDRLSPSALASGLAMLDAHPEAAFVWGHYRFVDAELRLLALNPPEVIVGDAYRSLLRSNLIGHCATVLFRREPLMEAGGFDSALAACEDYDLYLRLARRFPAARYADVIADYRLHASNMSRDAVKMLASVMRVLGRQRPHVRGNPEREQALSAGVRRYRAQYGPGAAAEFGRRLRRLGPPAPLLRAAWVLARHYPSGLFHPRETEPTEASSGMPGTSR